MRGGYEGRDSRGYEGWGRGKGGVYGGRRRRRWRRWRRRRRRRRRRKGEKERRGGAVEKEKRD